MDIFRVSSMLALQVPNAYTFRKAPIFAREIVVSGFGRGSKQMGVPTANLKPEALFSGPLKELPLGVYFGFVSLISPSYKRCYRVCSPICRNT